MRRKKAIGMIAALVLAAVGTLALTTYVRTARDRAVAGEELVEVIVADKNVPAGTPAGDLGAYVRTDRVPSKVRPSEAITNISEVQGLVAAVDLLEGEQLLRSRFATAAASKTTAGPCSSKAAAPAGMHEVSLTLDAIRALGGNVRAGNTVALNVSFDGDQPATKLMAHKVLVTCVASTLVEEKPAQGAAPVIASKLLITFAVDPAIVDKVVFAAEFGRIWLSSEPKDAPVAADEPVTRTDILNAKDAR